MVQFKSYRTWAVFYPVILKYVTIQLKDKHCHIQRQSTSFITWFKRKSCTSKSCLFPTPRLTYREWIGQLLRTYKAADKQLVTIFTEPVVMMWLSTELTSPARDACLLSVVIFMDTILFVQLLAGEIMPLDDFIWISTIYVTHFC